MGFVSLKKAIGFVLRRRAPGKKRKVMPSTAFPLASACDIAAFALLDLPTELAEAIIAEMINVVGFYRAVRLRFINKFFDKTVTNIIFSHRNAHLLPEKRGWPLGGSTAGRVAFARILQTKIDDEASAQSPLHRAITACIDLLESLPRTSRHRSDLTNQRDIYKSILCASTTEKLSMREVFRNLSVGGQDRIEAPSKGALTVASALGDVSLIEALISQGARVDDESSFFCYAIVAAAEHGHIDAVKTLLTHAKSDWDYIFAAIEGGNRDIVQLFLDKYYTKSWSITANLSRFGSRSIHAQKEKEELVLCAAANDQTAILRLLMRYYPPSHRPQILRRALYCAVQFYSMSVITALLGAGIDVSPVDEGFGTALHLASSRGDLQIVQSLLDHGFEDFGGCCYTDCMHIAVAKGHPDVVQLFLDRGVDVNSRFNNSFSNPLGIKFWEDLEHVSSAYLAPTNAARRGDFHMFCLLVRRGAKVDVEGDEGPLQKRWLDRIRAWEVRFSTGE